MDIQMERNFPDYRDSFYTKAAFVKYLTSNNDVSCAVENCNSSSESDFQNWKEKGEIRNLVCFSKQRGDKCG